MKIKKSKGRIAFEIINYTVLTLLALICILPFIHLLAMSFSSDEFTSKGVVFSSAERVHIAGLQVPSAKK